MPQIFQTEVPGLLYTLLSFSWAILSSPVVSNITYIDNSKIYYLTHTSLCSLTSIMHHLCGISTEMSLRYLALKIAQTIKSSSPRSTSKSAPPPLFSLLWKDTSVYVVIYTRNPEVILEPPHNHPPPHTLTRL